MKKLIGFLGINEADKRFFLVKDGFFSKIPQFYIEISDDNSEPVSREVNIVNALQNEFAKNFFGARMSVTDYLCDCEEIVNDKFVNISVYRGIIHNPDVKNELVLFTKEDLFKERCVSHGTKKCVNFYCGLLERNS